MGNAPYAVGMFTGSKNIFTGFNCDKMIRTAALMNAERFFIFGPVPDIVWNGDITEGLSVKRQYYHGGYITRCDMHFAWDNPLDPSIDVHFYPDSGEYILEVCEKFKYTPIWAEHGGTLLPVGNEEWPDGNPILMFGREAGGIPEDIMNMFPDSLTVTIPCDNGYGYHVVSAMSIVAWEYNKYNRRINNG